MECIDDVIPPPTSPELPLSETTEFGKTHQARSENRYCSVG